MNKIKQLLSDHRDRKLREKLLYHYNSPFCAAIAFRFIKTGRLDGCDELYEQEAKENGYLFRTMYKTR